MATFKQQWKIYKERLELEECKDKNMASYHSAVEFSLLIGRKVLINFL